MRRRGYHHQSADVEESLINLTPLIDVVFVVLIMFILIAPLLDIDRIALADSNPEKARQETIQPQDKNAIKITVDAEDKVRLNGRLLETDQLKKALIALKREHPNEIPKLFQDRNGHFGTYQTVKNAVEASGFEEIDVILKPR